MDKIDKYLNQKPYIIMTEKNFTTHIVCQYGENPDEALSRLRLEEGEKVVKIDKAY